MPWALIVLSHDDGAHDRLSAITQRRCLTQRRYLWPISRVLLPSQPSPHPFLAGTTSLVAWTKALSPSLRASKMSKDHMWCECSRCSLANGGRLLQAKRTRQRHIEADRRDGKHVAVEERENPRHVPAVGSPQSHSSDSEPGPPEPWFDNEPHLDLYNDDPMEGADDFESDGGAGRLFSSDDEDDAYRLLLPYGQAEELVEEDRDDERSDDDDFDLVDDPAFDVVNVFGVGGDDDDSQPADDDTDLFDEPPAFEEHSAIRNAYVRAYIATAFKGATHDVARLIVDGVARALSSARNQAPEVEFDGLDDMARTLPTIEHRLGVNLNSIITYLFLCPTCWRVHDSSSLYNEDLNERCDEEECDGILYTTKRLASGKHKRKPTKVLPYVSPQRAIQHWLLRPGKYEQLQEWRKEGDEPARVPPIFEEGMNAFPDVWHPIHDIHDAWGWRAIQAGLQRVCHDEAISRVYDEDVNHIQQRFVSLPCGLVWQINLD
ncbi:hypothetical protein DEU56DRAFT_884230, partial [Suillus clintonianus]|uniref:uncharacterized protein n=1 Tax=Suillus clintonianus TaxID=1904413 RepID=UPI001B85B9A4